MSIKDEQFTGQQNEHAPSGRNPIVLIGGLVLLAGAFLLLIFGGNVFGGGELGDEQATAGPSQNIAAQLPESGPPLQVGDAPYEFALQGVDGQVVTLSQFSGRPLLINFWATWCGPCRLEMPELQAVWEAHQQDGLVVLALNQAETAAEVTAYFDELGLTFTPLLDQGSDTARNYGLGSSLPSSVFINAAGRVTAIHRGIMTRGQIDDYLAETLS